MFEGKKSVTYRCNGGAYEPEQPKDSQSNHLIPEECYGPVVNPFVDDEDTAQQNNALASNVHVCLVSGLRLRATMVWD